MVLFLAHALKPDKPITIGNQLIRSTINYIWLIVNESKFIEFFNAL